MAVTQPDLKDIKRRMDGALEALRREFAGLRAGRASASLLEPVVVDAYGTKMPLNQVGAIGVPDPRLLTIQVWDKGLVKSVERAIMEADLGLNPQTEGQLIRVPIPDLTEERRHELTKIAHKYGEQARVAVRNVRRDGMDMLKRMEKAGEISQDDQHGWAKDVQQLTDDHVALIDKALETKEQEIMQV
jgi:ribosome recycling factor